jgi:hypothetical protein
MIVRKKNLEELIWAIVKKRFLIEEHELEMKIHHDYENSVNGIIKRLDEMEKSEGFIDRVVDRINKKQLRRPE